MNRTRIRFSLAMMAALVCLSVGSLKAASVDSATASLFVGNWLQAANNPVVADGIERTLTDPQAITMPGSDEVLAYAINLKPYGFVIVAADTLINPVVMHSAGGQYDPDPRNPLVSLVLTDMATRKAAVETELRSAEQSEYYAANEGAWSKYTSETRSKGANVLQEVWVDKLVQTEWGQNTVNGQAVFNYYTPTVAADGTVTWEEGNAINAVSGCTATTLAQLMNYYRWPQKAIGNQQGTVRIGTKDNQVGTTLTVTRNYRGGNGHGGAYNWDLMVNCPSITDKTDPRYQELTDESIRAMGALLADAGLTNGMHYYSTNYGDASGANVSATRCKERLGYYGANTFSASDRTQIRAALDAHRPWAVSISSPNDIFGEEGHSILCDGYGRVDGRWYYHLNMGWNGGSDGWYNLEDYFEAGSLWSNGISCQWGNIYRQQLQTNDAESGKIIAGRVTDANGNPVAGVKVSISKGGALWQSMLVWNETVDGSDPYAVRSPIDADAVDGVFRNYTDANGIWFVDKVAPGDYTVNLEKDGFTFLGDVNVTVASKNVWGIGFVAVPDAVGALALENWWIDGGVLSLQFNRAIGDVAIDPSCITIGGVNLNGCTVVSAADSAIVTIDVSSLAPSGNLSMTSGAFYYDVDGSTDEPGTYDVPVVNVAPVVADQAAGTASSDTAAVTAITRNGNDFNTAASELEFLVTGTGLDDDSINDFKLHITDSFDGTEGTYARVNASTLPAAAIGDWDASTGILKVTVGSGYGFVRVDYVPADGSTPFVAGETYRVNKQGPVIISATLAKNNAYVDVTFSKPVGGAGTVSALSGIQASADGQYYRTNADGAIWSKGVCNTPDAAYNGGIDGNAIIGSNTIEDGTAGTLLPSVIQLTQASMTVNGGKLMWADMDEDGVFTPGIDGIFLKICDEVKYYREHGEEMALLDKALFVIAWQSSGGTYTDGNLFIVPDDTSDSLRDRWISNNSEPTKTGTVIANDSYPAYDLNVGMPAKLYYYHTDGALLNSPFTNQTDLMDCFGTLMYGTGNGVWLDYSIDSSTNFVAGQDTVLFGSMPADGSSGSAVPDTLYYIDMDASGSLSRADFIWNDDNGDGAWTGSGDTIVGTVPESVLNWHEPLAANDFDCILHANGGTLTGAYIDGITDTFGNPLTSAVSTVRLTLGYSPSLNTYTFNGESSDEAANSFVNTMNVPSGVETIEIMPYEESIFDADDNAAPASSSTGELVLYGSGNPYVVAYSLGFDNYSLAIRFSERIYGSSKGFDTKQLAAFMSFNASYGDASAAGADQEVWAEASKKVRGATRNMPASCFTVQVNYLNASNATETATLQLTQNGPNQAIRYKTGTAFVVLDFATALDLETNAKLLDPVYQSLVNSRTPVSLTVTISNVADAEGNLVANNSFTVALREQYNGSTLTPSLPPPMFTNANGAYTLVTASDQSPMQNGLYVRVSYSNTHDDTIVVNSVSGGLTVACTDVAGKDPRTYTKYDNTGDFMNLGESIVLRETVPGTYTYVKTNVHNYQVTYKDSSNNDVTEDRTAYCHFYTFEPTESGINANAAMAEGLEYYGIYYRDLDADGRIDAIDLNFHNPWHLDYGTGRFATLHVNEAQAKNNFKVYIRATQEKNEDTWGGYKSWSDYPLTQSKDGEIEALIKGGAAPASWIPAMVTGVSIVEENVNANANDYFSMSGKYWYTTVRVTIDQTGMPPATYGDDRVAIAYLTPRALTEEDRTYNKRHGQGITAMPLKYHEFSDSEKYEYNYGFTEKLLTNYAINDEQAGIYWTWDGLAGEDAEVFAGCIRPVWVCDSFGPVFAWDGAPAIALGAVAWRATPYAKVDERNGADDITSYEYVDVLFSEPLGLAEDRGLRDSAGIISGWTNSKYALTHGVLGADLINSTTVRFKLDRCTKELDLNFLGALYPMSGAIEHAWSTNSFSPEFTRFNITAAGVLPICSAYQVTGGPNDKIPVFQITNSESTVTNKVAMADSPNGDHHDWLVGSTLEYTAIPKSRTVSGENRDGWTFRSNGGQFDANKDFALTWDGDTAYVAAPSTATRPGTSYYAVLQNMTIENTTVKDYFPVATYPDYSKSPVMRPWGGVTAPAPNAWSTWAQTTPNTPASGVLSGPIYNYMSASAAEVLKTSRINAGTDYAILGIDAAGASGQKLTGVTIRFVSTNYGQFDPAVDLLPLTDGASSGVYLYDETSGSVVKISTNGLEWSDWKVNAYGQPYRETTLRPLNGVALPAAGGDPNSFDVTVHIVPSSDFNLGDSFYAEIPADGLVMGSYASGDSYKETWTTADGTQGFPLTAFQYYDANGDKRWNVGEPIADAEDMNAYSAPFYDGGKPFFTYRAMTSHFVLEESGLETRNLYYAKKNGATHATTSRYNGVLDAPSIAGIATHANVPEMWKHVNYEPGDDVWYDIGGRPGVYDAGVDVPLFGNADKFVLPWAPKQGGAKSAWFHGAPHSEANSVTTGIISAPSGEIPVAIVGLNMEDTGRGFGPRYILGGAVLVEAISKNLPAGEFELTYTTDGSLAFDGGSAEPIPTEVGARAILVDAAGTGFVVIRRMADLYDADEDGDLAETVELPADDKTIPFGVSEDLDRDIQQPQAITGVRVIAVGNGNTANATATLTRTGTKLAWKGGTAVDVADGGIFVLKGKAADDYLTVQVTMVGGAASEDLMVYQADGQPITPFQNITGLEVMAVGDMIRQGFYTFSYDGSGSLSFGNGGPCAVPASVGKFAFVYGDGLASDYSRPFVVVRRTAAALPSSAVTDSLFINQTQLFQVNVTLKSVNGVTPSHFEALTNDETSGISLWWDADASGVFSGSDMFVPLLEAPVLEGTGDSWKCSLTPDPAYLTAWLSRAKDVTADNRNNFFVCVRTTVDMTGGDQFTVSADFYDPTEPNYTYKYYDKDTGTIACFAHVESDVVTCTSVTNTILAKMTVPGQTVDAGTNVPMVSVSHFVNSSSLTPPYVSQLSFDLYSVLNFDPEAHLKSTAKATAVAERGIVLYKDADGDGELDTEVDTPIDCFIKMEHEDGSDLWHYTLDIDGTDCKVATTEDEVPDLFVIINTAENLPFNITFYGRMESDYITYNTGVGSASAFIRTDNLTSTVNSDYQQVAGIYNYDAAAGKQGVFVTATGSGVNGLQTITVTKQGTNLVVAWGSYSVKVPAENGITFLTLGSGANALTIALDPTKFDSWEDGQTDTWNIMVSGSIVAIRRFSEDANLNSYYDYATGEPYKAAASAIIGLDIATDGISDLKLTSLTVNFKNENGFSTSDLLNLTADETSGVQLWKDNGNGVFEPEYDTLVPLAAAPTWDNDGENYTVKLSPASLSPRTGTSVIRLGGQTAATGGPGAVPPT